MTQSKLRIVFFGTPDFAAFSLEKIVKSGFHVVGVVTAMDKPAGRGQKIAESADVVTFVAAGLPMCLKGQLP